VAQISRPKANRALLDDSVSFAQVPGVKTAISARPSSRRARAPPAGSAGSMPRHALVAAMQRKVPESVGAAPSRHIGEGLCCGPVGDGRALNDSATPISHPAHVLPEEGRSRAVEHPEDTWRPPPPHVGAHNAPLVAQGDREELARSVGPRRSRDSTCGTESVNNESLVISDPDGGMTQSSADAWDYIDRVLSVTASNS